MPHVVFSNAANEDIVSILEWSHKNFGEQARIRYEALLTQAIIDIAEWPDRPGCVAREKLAADARTYHLWHSRNRVNKTLGVVNRPRHFLLFRINAHPTRPGMDASDLPGTCRGKSMKLDFLALPDDERRLYIEQAAIRKSLSPVIMEKDFWVC